MILGGLIVVALFAALIAPWFVNWNDYRATFEAEAGRILGQPVVVAGTASASILPSPSLTFTDVRVGETEGKPMMAVDRFEVTIEMMPLLQGEIRVVSMKLRRPVVAVSVDDSGTVDWLIRNQASETLDPDKVILENVEIADGRISYSDASTGISKVFDKINAAVEAGSLSGPWRVEGSYLDAGRRVPFRISTGRRAENGSIRVKTELSPADWAVSLVADGDVASDADGVFYKGTYNLAEVVPAGGEGEPEGDSAIGWRSEGAFTLTRDRLDIEKAVLSEGPPERPYSVAGSLVVDLGPQQKFEATIQARQLDLDRSLGAGPTAPVEPAAAAQSLVAWLSTLYVPTIPGKLAFSVPGVIVGGALIQDASFLAEPAADGWRISNLRASLPGQANLEADGTLTTADGVGFSGDVHLAVRQPTSFAAWWRGKAQEGAGRLLAPFDLSGSATIAPGQFSIDGLAASVGDATLRGRFAWTEAKTRDRRRHLGTDLSADRIDYTQLRALAELLVGKDLADTGAIADSYAVKLSTQALAFDELTLRDVGVDASYADDALTVNEFRIGDLGGASVNVTKGRIDTPLTSPRGRLEGSLTAPASLEGFAAVVARLAPDSTAARWLAKAAPAMVPAVLNVSIAAPAKDGGPGFHLTVEGVAAATTLSAAIDLSGSPADWRKGKAGVSLTLDSPDAVGLARQAGFSVPANNVGGGSHIVLTAAGTPASGVDLVLAGDFGGLSVGSTGKLALPPAAEPTYAGSLKLESADLGPLMRLAALDIPGAAAGTPLALEGTIETRGLSGTLAWQNGRLADRQFGGRTTIGRRGDGSLDLAGALTVDEVDLNWLMALGLGFAIEPTGDKFSPWSKAPFAEPDYGAVHGKFAVTADRFWVGEGLDVAHAALDVGLDPHRVDVAVKSGAAFGGSIAGGLTINNIGGNTNVTGRVELKGGTLDALVWQRAGRAVGTGTLDLSANFEAAGRSPAGLISSLTGGGTFAVRDGEARYINPRAVTLIIRAADLGQEFTDDALREAFLSYIDGGSLAFREASVPFSIAAGTIRMQSLAVASDGVGASGGATLDLNTLDLDSDWTLSFEAGDDKAKGTVPQVGIVFRGPLAGPGRIVDVVQFGAYLNIRQEERIQEILSLEQADRAEKERLNRLKRKLREDAARRARDATEAAAAEAERRAVAAAAARTIEAFHVDREAFAVRRNAAALGASLALAAAGDAAEAAKSATLARTAADEAADAAVERAASAKAAVREAADGLAAAVEAEADAGKALAAAEAERAAAAKLSADAQGAARDAGEVVAIAEAVVAEKSAAETAARAAAENAAAEKATADKAVIEKAAVLIAAETLVAGAADEDANAAGAATDAAARAEEAALASATAGEASRNANADAAKARQAASEADGRLVAARAARAAAEGAERQARAAITPQPQVDVSGTPQDAVRSDALAAAAGDFAAATAELAAAEEAKGEADKTQAATAAAAKAARGAAREAAGVADRAAKDKLDADRRLMAAGAARHAAEKAVADATSARQQAIEDATDKALALIRTATAVDAAAAEVAAAKAAAASAAEAAAVRRAEAEAADAFLAGKTAAVDAAIKAAKAAAAKKAAAENAAAGAAQLADRAAADAGTAAAAATKAAAAEAEAMAAAEKAAAAARKSAAGLAAFDSDGPSMLSPIAGSTGQDPPVKPKRPPKRATDQPSLLLLPRAGR